MIRILNLNYVSPIPEFAKKFSEELIHQMSDMYSEYQTEKTRLSLNNLQNRSDSVFYELQKKYERNLARVKDRNLKVVTSSGRLDEIKYMREVKVLNMYLELVKNLEILKMTLLEDTQLFRWLIIQFFHYNL